MRFEKATAGFTVIEIIVVIAILGFLVAVAAPFLASSVQQNDLRVASQDAVDALREAQSSAMNGRGAGRFGVHFETDQFIYFEGPTYNVADPDNVVHELTGNVTTSGISIAGGGSDIHFASHKGDPTETGSIEFTDVGGDTATVSINAIGMIEVN